MSLLINTDQERFVFLQELDEHPDIDVTDWEARFIESQLQRGVAAGDEYNLPRNFFTMAQRRVIQRMHDSYGALL